MNTIFFNMPEGYDFSPYLALPLLKAYIENNSKHSVKTIDASIIYTDYILSNKFCAEIADSILKDGINEKKDLFYYAQAKYLSQQIEKTKNCLKSKNTYTDIEIVYKSLVDIEAVSRTIGYWNKKHCPSDSISKLSYLVNNESFTVLGKWLNSFFKSIDWDKYSVVAFSVSYQKQLIPSLYFANLIKQRFPKKIIVFGGNIITHYKREICHDKAFWKYIDYCIFYQGERALVELFNSIENGNFEYIENVAYLSNNKLKYEYNEAKLDVGFTIPDFSDIQFDLYLSPYRTISLLTSKGCYWAKCKYCSHYTGYGTGYFNFEIEKVCEAISILSEKHSIDYIYFVDEAMPYANMMKIAEYIKLNNINIKWYCETRIECPLIDEHNIEFLKDGGCEFLICGVESGNQEVLDDMNKGICINDVYRFLQSTSKKKIGTLCMYFIDFPTEKESQTCDTFNFISRTSKLGTISTVGFFCLEKNTDIFIHPEEYGIREIIDKDAYYNMNPDYILENGEISTIESRSHHLEFLKEKYKQTAFVENRLTREALIFLTKNNAYDFQKLEKVSYDIDVYIKPINKKVTIDIVKRKMTWK